MGAGRFLSDGFKNCLYGIIINVVCCVGRVKIKIEIYKKVGVLPIRIVWSNVSSVGPSSERNRK